MDYFFNTEEYIQMNVDCIGDRAKWFALLAKHIPEQYFEEAAPKAIWDHGMAKVAKTAGTPGCIQDFVAKICEMPGKLVFQNELVEMDDDHAVIHLNRCPLVEGWIKMNLSKDQIAHYCDLICNGDYGHADGFGLKLKFNALIAHGEPYCEMYVTKK